MLWFNALWRVMTHGWACKLLRGPAFFGLRLCCASRLVSAGPGHRITSPEHTHSGKQRSVVKRSLSCHFANRSGLHSACKKASSAQSLHQSCATACNGSYRSSNRQREDQEMALSNPKIHINHKIQAVPEISRNCSCQRRTTTKLQPKPHGTQRHALPDSWNAERVSQLVLVSLSIWRRGCSWSDVWWLFGGPDCCLWGTHSRQQEFRLPCFLTFLAFTHLLLCLFSSFWNSVEQIYINLKQSYVKFADSLSTLMLAYTYNPPLADQHSP